MGNQIVFRLNVFNYVQCNSGLPSSILLFVCCLIYFTEPDDLPFKYCLNYSLNSGALILFLAAITAITRNFSLGTVQVSSFKIFYISFPCICFIQYEYKMSVSQSFPPWNPLIPPDVFLDNVGVPCYTFLIPS